MAYSSYIRHRGKGMRPARVIALGFALLILAGALLLSLPAASADGSEKDMLTCLFTSTSATCVTGLVLADTGTEWSVFGQAVILVLIQIGGLGFITMAMSFSIIMKRSISPKQRLLLAHSFNLSSFNGIVRLTKYIVRGTLFFEIIGTICLMTRFVPLFGWKTGIWRSVFTSVSAFCNAGFDLMGDYSGSFSSLSAFSGDFTVCITVMLLIVTGGIGFVVWNEIVELIFKKRQLSVYSKFVMISSAVLILIGAAVFLLSEWNNPGTLGNLPAGEKILASFFQSITTRTAGFNTVSMVDMNPGTKLMFLLLMFIGGCSGSTAGGVKVGTFSVSVWTVLCVLMGKSDIVIFGRRISRDTILRAFSVIVLHFCVTVIGGLIILTCGCGIMQAMFEAFSASGTVGLTLSLTGSMNEAGKITAMLLMYFGRVGILTVSYAVLARLSQAKPEFRNAEAKLLIG